MAAESLQCLRNFLTWLTSIVSVTNILGRWIGLTFWRSWIWNKVRNRITMIKSSVPAQFRQWPCSLMCPDGFLPCLCVTKVYKHVQNIREALSSIPANAPVCHWRFLVLPGLTTAFKITTQRLNINYILFGLLVQVYY